MLITPVMLDTLAGLDTNVKKENRGQFMLGVQLLLGWEIVASAW
jgi:hypothetical protein